MMRRWQKWAMALMTILGLSLPLAGAGADDGHAHGDLSREQIEAIVRDYLMREPEVVFQALEELQRRQAATQSERQQAAIKSQEDQLLRDPEAPVAGNPDGGVTLVEFFDYRCHYCRRVVGSVQELIEEDTDLRLVFKELPVLGEDSIRAARAALASRKQDRYLPFHFALMDSDDLVDGGHQADRRVDRPRCGAIAGGHGGAGGRCGDPGQLRAGQSPRYRGYARLRESVTSWFPARSTGPDWRS